MPSAMADAFLLVGAEEPLLDILTSPFVVKATHCALLATGSGCLIIAVGTVLQNFSSLTSQKLMLLFFPRVSKAPKGVSPKGHFMSRKFKKQIFQKCPQNLQNVNPEPSE